MKLIRTIKSIVNENKDNSISDMIKTLGVSDAIKYFGNYYKIEPYLKEIDKVNFIKEKVMELSDDDYYGIRFTYGFDELMMTRVLIPILIRLNK